MGPDETRRLDCIPVNVSLPGPKSFGIIDDDASRWVEMIRKVWGARDTGDDHRSTEPTESKNERFGWKGKTDCRGGR